MSRVLERPHSAAVPIGRGPAHIRRRPVGPRIRRPSCRRGRSAGTRRRCSQFELAPIPTPFLSTPPSEPYVAACARLVTQSNHLQYLRQRRPRRRAAGRVFRSAPATGSVPLQPPNDPMSGSRGQAARAHAVTSSPATPPGRCPQSTAPIRYCSCRCRWNSGADLIPRSAATIAADAGECPSSPASPPRDFSEMQRQSWPD